MYSMERTKNEVNKEFNFSNYKSRSGILGDSIEVKSSSSWQNNGIASV
jgi:hypothetical protein